MADPDPKTASDNKTQPNPPAPAASKADASKTQPMPDKGDNRPEPDQVRDTSAEDSVRSKDADTVKTAGIGSVVDPEMKFSDHMAQRFGNSPSNPKLPPYIPEDYDGPLVRLTLVSPDNREGAVADVHPDVVGDYLRAGYSKL